MAMELNSSSFKTEIADYKGAALVDFWAPWCGPCRMMTPILESLSGKMAGKVKIAKLNVDDSPEIAAQFNVSTIPTLIFFKDGKAVHTSIGVVPEAELESQIKANLL
ncbi:MAG: thioredoxin [Candidatus Riflebacteria bacterium HGW-Riflebacteria-2]|jgi:thioredoxin|nr:MAG: thioredoxin [Candidatus Riflebacteria bacterium HGW-Riflebacteria-2]